jgi:hypothetical protein
MRRLLAFGEKSIDPRARARYIAAAALLLLCGLVAPARADDTALFREANQDYAAQRYDLAIAKYEQLAEGGLRHEVLYYNLGNACFRAAQQGQPGRLGRAILAYERALEIDPDFEDARFNLGVARDLVETRFGKDTIVGAAKDPLWIRVATWLPHRTLLWIFLGLDVAFFAVLIALRFLPTGFLRTGLVVSTVFCGVAGMLAGGLLILQVFFHSTVDRAVVVADEVIMREGPDPSRRELPKLHAGHRVIVLKENHGWLRIRLANRMEGWVPKETIETI